MHSCFFAQAVRISAGVPNAPRLLIRFQTLREFLNAVFSQSNSHPPKMVTIIFLSDL